MSFNMSQNMRYCHGQLNIMMMILDHSSSDNIIIYYTSREDCKP